MISTVIDPGTPVIIGIAQRTGSRADLPGPEPLVAWEQVCRGAIADAGLNDAVIPSVDGLFLADSMSWRYDDPVARLAERLYMATPVRAVSAPSGTSGQTLMDKAAAHIREGTAQALLVCGGEALASVRAYAKQGSAPPWSHVHADGPAHAFDLDGHQHSGEVAVGLTEGVGAVYGFAMRDIARRAHLGIAPDAYRQQIGETLSGMTQVAAANPHAWFRDARDADFLATPRADNRMITYPYTKHMVAIIDVDISVALLVTSEGWADAHHVPRDRRVYPWTSCYAEDPVYIAVRDRLWKSDAMEAASKAALDAAGLTMDDIAHVDLYSCFASAVNFARDALGIADRGGDRITVTGGLPYAGGPGSAYVLTSIARMVETLRADPGAKGLVSGLGMMMSNHVFAIYASDPPGPNVRQPDRAAVQASVDMIPQRPINDAYTGSATVAAYTVMHERDGHPSHGAAICDLPDGGRSYARILAPDLLAEAERSELVGRTVQIAPGEAIGEIVRLL